MQIDEGTYKRLPAHLQALFERLPNPSSDEVTALFPETQSRSSNTPQPIMTSKGIRGGAFGNDAARKPEGHPTHPEYLRGGFDDSGSAARFFYCAKASKRDRDEGLDGMPVTERRTHGDMAPDVSGTSHNTTGQAPALARNHHPTVKPTALMRYLCRLVTPPGGVVLDPFTGSGSTGKAAALEGFDFIGIELDAEYLEIARRRIEHAQMQPPLDGLA